MKLLVLILSAISTNLLHSQTLAPEKWTNSMKKTGKGQYEIHFKVSIEKPWHIYSQFTPAGGPDPVKIKLKENPLISIVGKIKEVGKMKQRHEEVFNVDVKYFEDVVDFVQTVQVKGNIKTNVSGTISYMICNDQKCLPPKNEKFNIVLTSN